MDTLMSDKKYSHLLRSHGFVRRVNGMKRIKRVVFMLAKETRHLAFDIRQLCPSEERRVLYNSACLLILNAAGLKLSDKL